ncbi:potassium channel subfamily K member 9 [Periplaneta americana]|uniref:potassium channel subfamily K member 9 n=1 Tax=Periplaneta americana TaxID=6978 RepID=UPI0037E829F4
MERKRSTRRYGRYRKKTWGQKCKDFFREFIAFMFSNVGIIGLVVGYTIAGAFIFGAIEGNEAPLANAVVLELRNKTALKLWDLSCCGLNVFSEENWRENVSTELLEYQQLIVEAIQNGFDGTDNVNQSLKWSFSGAFLYSLTVITTIGYGNIAPQTVYGKVTTILYAIIGIPLFLLYLSNIGDILANSFKWTYAKLCLCQGCCRVSRRQQMAPQQTASVGGFMGAEDWRVQYVVGADNATATRPEQGGGEPEHDVSEGDETSSGGGEEPYDPQTVTVPVTLCLTIMVGYVCFGAVLFSEWEEWDFLDSAYFCFISLSTIGFGDIVPGERIIKNQEIDLSFIFCSMYLMLGMALIAMCFNLMQEEVVHKMRTCMRSIKFMLSCRHRARRNAQEEAFETRPVR